MIKAARKLCNAEIVLLHVTVVDGRSLYLLGAPASVSVPKATHSQYPTSRANVSDLALPHVRRRLDARNVLENGVSDTDQGDDRAGRVFPPVVAHDNAADEDVDCHNHQYSYPASSASLIGQRTSSATDEGEHE